MENSESVRTEILDLNEDIVISTKLSAVNNKVRFSILEILRDFHNLYVDDNNNFKKNPYYSREINSILLNNYDINITPQMLGQHLKQLMRAGLIEEVIVKREVPNKVGHRGVKAYILKEDAFEDLFLEINFLSHELLSFFELYDINKRFHDGEHCVLTIFNGADKGKTFKINQNETVLIGRRDNYNESDLAAFTILLDNSYKSVSNVGKPHLKIFYKDRSWCVLDESSLNGTYIRDKKVPNGVVTKLKSNSFIKLSKGNDGAVIYCSF